MALWIGVDVGGTFTDIFACDPVSGRIYTHKTPSTPQDPSEAIIEGVEALLAAQGFAAGDVAQLAHGTTVATNTLIQRKGVRTALITTRGFRDLLEIGRQTRPLNYDMHTDYPPPVVPRGRRFEVAERIMADGSPRLPIDGADVETAVAAVKESGAEAVAVCFLFSYLTPDHERRVGEALAKALPGVSVSLSSEVQPEFREYERFSTTVLNAYLQPRMARYLENLRNRARQAFTQAPVVISQSSGGLMSLEQARRYPIRTALSGPAAGVVGAIETARLAERPGVITFDMGGTSADVALVQDYRIGEAYGRRIGGYPVRLPMVDINTIGAGGGSIAWFDKDDLLKVGPISAGAVPGPACYGQGGTEPTVTDANLLLGRLSTGGLLGGRMALDPARAAAAIAPVAQRLNLTPERTALGILEIVVANMVRAIRAISVERGYDPRALSLLAFGGAGPLHARDVAQSLDMKELLIPAAPGILCAAGLIASDLKENLVRTVRLRLEGEAHRTIAAELDGLVDAASRWFAAEKVGAESRHVSASLDMRYVGQNFELSIPLDAASEGAVPTLPSIEDLARKFWAAHERSYGFYNPQDPIELVNLRMVARRKRTALPPPPAPGGAPATPTAHGERSVWFSAEGPVQARLYDRTTLRPGQTIAGPAIIEQMDSTTLLYPRDTLTVDGAGNLLIAVNA